MKRFRFIIKRLLSMIVIMFLVSFLVFVVLRMSDADPLTVMIGNNQSTPELRQALTEKYHLDDPVHIQYLRWIKGVLSGDFGTDYVDGQDVKGLIMSRLPITFGLVIMSSVIGSVIAVIMGVAAALRKGRPSDAAISGLMLVLSGAPFIFGKHTDTYFHDKVRSWIFVYRNIYKFRRVLTTYNDTEPDNGADVRCDAWTYHTKQHDKSASIPLYRNSSCKGIKAKQHNLQARFSQRRYSCYNSCRIYDSRLYRLDSNS